TGRTGTAISSTPSGSPPAPAGESENGFAGPGRPGRDKAPNNRGLVRAAAGRTGPLQARRFPARREVQTGLFFVLKGVPRGTSCAGAPGLVSWKHPNTHPQKRRNRMTFTTENDRIFCRQEGRVVAEVTFP